MKRFVSILTTAAMTISSFAATVVTNYAYADNSFSGITDRAEYKNAGYNTRIVIDFNDVIGLTDADIAAKLSLKEEGSEDNTDGLSARLSEDKKSVYVDLGGCTLKSNASYTLTASGIPNAANTNTANVSVKVTTGSIPAVKYVNDGFEGYVKNSDWSEGNIPSGSKWGINATSGGYGLQASIDGGDAKALYFPGVKGKNLTNVRYGNTNGYTKAFEDLKVEVTKDPTGTDNNVLMIDAGNSSEQYDGKISARVIKNSDEQGKIGSNKTFVHSFRVYIPLEGIDHIASGWNEVKTQMFGAVATNGSFGDDYTYSFIQYNSSSEKPLMVFKKTASEYEKPALDTNRWIDVKYIIKNAESTSTHDVMIDNSKIRSNAVSDKSFTEKTYMGFGMSLAPVYKNDGKSPKIYYDDLKSYVLEGLTAADGTVADKAAFKPNKDKIIINFNNEVSAETVKQGIVVKKTGTETAIDAMPSVELADNKTTAIVTLQNGFESNTNYTLSFANTMKDVFGQALSNTGFNIEFTTGTVPVMQAYLINDSFDNEEVKNWVGNGYSGDMGKVWMVYGKANGDIGDELNSTLKYNEGKGAKCGTEHAAGLLGEAYLGIADAPDNSGNKAFKYSSGYTGANGKHGYRVLRNINEGGTDAAPIQVDTTKKLVTKYKIWIDGNMANTLAGLSYEDIPGVNTYLFGDLREMPEWCITVTIKKISGMQQIYKKDTTFVY